MSLIWVEKSDIPARINKGRAVLGTFNQNIRQNVIRSPIMLAPELPDNDPNYVSARYQAWLESVAPGVHTAILEGTLSFQLGYLGTIGFKTTLTGDDNVPRETLVTLVGLEDKHENIVGFEIVLDPGLLFV